MPVAYIGFHEEGPNFPGPNHVFIFFSYGKKKILLPKGAMAQWPPKYATGQCKTSFWFTRFARVQSNTMMARTETFDCRSCSVFSAKHTYIHSNGESRCRKRAGDSEQIRSKSIHCSVGGVQLWTESEVRRIILVRIANWTLDHTLSMYTRLQTKAFNIINAVQCYKMISDWQPFCYPISTNRE